IDKIHYRIVSTASPVLTHRIELRTVTSGSPSAAGVLYGSSTSITDAAVTAGNKTAAVNANSGVTIGDVAAIVFDLSAYTSGS
ncbi:hypothetical protein, partial [Listeria monocytogenes]|uniref:hypothetical protein n=1 Tax=Listeria monocytogenes TaxID=1639 RepID=UPI002FDC4EB3